MRGHTGVHHCRCYGEPELTTVASAAAPAWSLLRGAQLRIEVVRYVAVRAARRAYAKLPHVIALLHAGPILGAYLLSWLDGIK